MRGIVKEFPGVKALADVSFTLARGEALALVGENGAGKSTLMKVLSGVYPHGTYAGSILRDGVEMRFGGTADAESAGIAIIHQELSLFPDLTVLENLFVGRYPTTRLGTVDWSRMEAEARQILSRLNVGFGVHDTIRELSVGDGQMVEIARALLKQPAILILDEPTSALSDREVRRLFDVIVDIRSRGTACVYISHKLDEIYEVCSRAVVLRDGKSVGGGPLAEVQREQLIALMVGRSMTALFPPKLVAASDTPGLEVADLAARSAGRTRDAVAGVSFAAYPGEVLGIAGMMGAGRSELLYAIFGHPDYESTGSVRVAGAAVERRSIAAAMRHGLGLVTEDRKRNGLHLGLDIRENIAMASLGNVSRWGIVDRAKDHAQADTYIKRLGIKAKSDAVHAETLSGGNQQKVAIAKWAATKPKVLMLDEPTRGVDVGAKFEIYTLLRELAEQGMTVVVVSSEIFELVGLCHRVLVMREGRLAGQLVGDAVTNEGIAKLAIGGV
jgi:D-xylose transport system ATP-binding protein